MLFVLTFSDLPDVLIGQPCMAWRTHFVRVADAALSHLSNKFQILRNSIAHPYAPFKMQRAWFWGVHCHLRNSGVLRIFGIEHLRGMQLAPTRHDANRRCGPPVTFPVGRRPGHISETLTRCHRPLLGSDREDEIYP